MDNAYSAAAFFSAERQGRTDGGETMRGQERQVDFGKHGEFLEETVKYIVECAPDALAFGGILPDGNFIGAYSQTSMNDKFIIAGNILLDCFRGFIRANAAEIRDILENADESQEGDIML